MTDAAGTRSVLLVESEEASRNRASTVLGRAGLGVAAVGDGKRGLQESSSAARTW